MLFNCALDVNTDGLNKTNKTLVAALAYCVAEREDLLQAKEKIRSLSWDLKWQGDSTSDTQESLVAMSSTRAVDDVIADIKARYEEDRKRLTEESKNISKKISRNMKRSQEIHHLMVKKGFNDWQNKAFYVDSMAYNKEFLKDDPETPGGQIVDVEKVMEQLKRDLRYVLPANLKVDEVCDIVDLETTARVKHDRQHPTTIVSVVFNQAYAEEMRKAIADLIEREKSKVVSFAKAGTLNDNYLHERAASGQLDVEEISREDGRAIEKHLPYTFSSENELISLEMICAKYPAEARFDYVNFDQQYPMVNRNKYKERHAGIQKFFDGKPEHPIRHNELGFDTISRACLKEYYLEARKDPEVDLTACIEELDEDIRKKELRQKRKEEHKLQSMSSDLSM